jgi:peptidoglycan/LPS O-acetylase OafA/YrhL
MWAVDALRGVAVIMVMLTHLPYARGTDAATGELIAATPAWFNTLVSPGHFGVHMFLVISGFCIHLQWARVGRLDATVAFFPFWRKRLTRLYPPYFVALVGSLGLLWAYGVMQGTGGRLDAASFGYTSGSLLLMDIVLLLLLSQNLTGASQRVGNGPFWSLALEEQLYLMYFPLLWMRRRWGWGAVLATSTMVCLAWRAVPVWLWPEAPKFWPVVGPALWSLWVLGALAVEGRMGLVTLPSWTRNWALGLGLTGAVLVAEASHVRDANAILMWLDGPLFGLGCFVLTNALCSYGQERDASLVFRVLAWVGVRSYALYLVHMPAYGVVKGLLGTDTPVAAMLFARVAAAVVASLVFYRLFELPAVKWASGIKSMKIPKRAA